MTDHKSAAPAHRTLQERGYCSRKSDARADDVLATLLRFYNAALQDRRNG